MKWVYFGNNSQLNILETSQATFQSVKPVSEPVVFAFFEISISLNKIPLVGNITRIGNTKWGAHIIR